MGDLELFKPIDEIFGWIVAHWLLWRSILNVESDPRWLPAKLLIKEDLATVNALSQRSLDGPQSIGAPFFEQLLEPVWFL